MNREELARFLQDFPWMGLTECAVCKEYTLYAAAHRPGCGVCRTAMSHPAPETCGRWACRE